VDDECPPIGDMLLYSHEYIPKINQHLTLRHVHNEESRGVKSCVDAFMHEVATSAIDGTTFI
jgi:hypothetical protein